MPAYGYHYQYDGIGNRTQATEGEAQPLAYHANLLNQYTNLGQNVIPLTGSASADATVTVKATVGETSTYYTPDRQGEAFAVDIPIPPGAGEVTTDLEINAVRFDSEQDLDLVKTVTGSYTASSQPMTYDADGNLLTWDGWLFTWNGENRLVRAEKGLLKIEANYDYMGRRFEKKVYNGETLTKHQRFIYNGYKLIEIRDALNENALETAYFWQPQALDVPIAMKQGTTLGFFDFDGNKNITAIRAQDGTTLAEYHYGPFGQTLSMTGDWAAVNPFRFSSEYHDEETNLIYYNYRHYSPTLGRWLSRDPMEEQGGINLYAMAGNNVIYLNDILGLWTVSGNSSVAAAYIAGGELNFNWSVTVEDRCCTEGLLKGTMQPHVDLDLTVVGDVMIGIGGKVKITDLVQLNLLLKGPSLSVSRELSAKLNCCDGDMNAHLAQEQSFSASLGINELGGNIFGGGVTLDISAPMKLVVGVYFDGNANSGTVYGQASFWFSFNGSLRLSYWVGSKSYRLDDVFSGINTTFDEEPVLSKKWTFAEW